MARMEGTNEIPGIPLEAAVHACMFWAFALDLPVSKTAPDADSERFSRIRPTGLGSDRSPAVWRIVKRPYRTS
jgi:hypothetical protein